MPFLIFVNCTKHHDVSMHSMNGSNFQSQSFVKWSPHQANVFVVGNEDLRFYESHSSSSSPATTQRQSTFQLLHVNSVVSQLRSFEWFPNLSSPYTYAVGLSSGKLTIHEYQNNANDASMQTNKREFVPKYSRPCNAIAWNAHYLNQVAVGLEKVRSDYCTLIWDIEYATASAAASASPARPDQASAPTFMKQPLYELANSEATVALAWVPDQPKCLATGTGFKWLRMYDLRATALAPSYSVVAHAKAVHGVVFDPFRPQYVATYSDAPYEMAKVWDVRKLGGRQAATPVALIQPTSKVLADVCWSPTERGILATISYEERWISFWDLNGLPEHQQSELQSPATSSQVFRRPNSKRYASEVITSFDWKSTCVTSKDQTTTTTTDEEDAFSYRLLINTHSQNVQELLPYDSMPVAMSCRQSLSFGFGRFCFGGQKLPPCHDIAEEMLALAHVSYGMNVPKNIEIFSQGVSSPPVVQTQIQQWRQKQLLQIWTWVWQLESLQSELLHHDLPPQVENDDDDDDDAPPHWVMTDDILTECGIDYLLSSYPDGNNLDRYTESRRHVDTEINCHVYTGAGRSAALLTCQWDPRERKSSGRLAQRLIPSMMNAGEYERAGALAVFHGDLRAGVRILQKGAKAVSDVHRSNSMQLVAMNIAGFTCVGKHSSSSNDDEDHHYHSSLWLETSQELTRRPCFVIKTTSSRYLRAICVFLSATSTSKDFSKPETRVTGELKLAFERILADSSLLLRDRIGFACRFLPSTDLATFIQDRTHEGEKRGALETLMLTGLGPRGLSVLQRYLDRTGDVQTVALLVARIPQSRVEEPATVAATHVFSSVPSHVKNKPKQKQKRQVSQHHHPTSSSGQWIQQYQHMLNQWQCWHERAKLDVERGKLEERRRRRQQLNTLTQRHQETSQPSNNNLRPQMCLKCNFCGISLSLENLLRQQHTPASSSASSASLNASTNVPGGPLPGSAAGSAAGSSASATWLSRSNPKLSCCPGCRKPLPQCALCLMPLGTLNPYFELAHIKSRQRAALDSGHSSHYHHLHKDHTSEDVLAELGSIPLAEWFTFCQSCKHGGHAHHMAEWFDHHDHCPVTDCPCHCRSLDAFEGRRRTRGTGPP